MVGNKLTEMFALKCNNKIASGRIATIQYICTLNPLNFRGWHFVFACGVLLILLSRVSAQIPFPSLHSHYLSPLSFGLFLDHVYGATKTQFVGLKLHSWPSELCHAEWLAICFPGLVLSFCLALSVIAVVRGIAQTVQIKWVHISLIIINIPIQTVVQNYAIAVPKIAH